MTQAEFNDLLRTNPNLRIEMRHASGETYTVPATVVSVPAPANDALLPPKLFPHQPKHESLSVKFERMWAELDGPTLAPEFPFHPARKWRADYCHVETKVLIELEGGVWDGGRHTRGPGFINDIAKYNAATMLGYRLLRLPTGGVKAEVLQEMIDFIRRLS